MKNENCIIIISGPSGSGKNSVIAGLKQKIPSLAEIPTYTTRPARPNEKQKGDRIFVSPEKFDRLFRAGKMVEKNFYNNHWFGTAKSALQKSLNSGKIPILEIDVNGFKALKKLYGKKVVGIFIFAKPEDLKKRLQDRGDVTPEQIKQRLKISRTETEQSRVFNFKIENRQNQLTTTIRQIIDFLKKINII